MSHTIDEFIDDVSKFYWDTVTSKINLNNFKCDFPLVVIKEIDNIQNICSHISFSKYKNKLDGYFYIHNVLGEINHQCSNCCSDEKSFHVNKSFYMNHKFFSHILIDSKRKIKLNFDTFKKDIYHLLKNIIPNLKFNIFFGKYEIKNMNESNESNEVKIFKSLINIFKDSENLKTISDLCPVCHEETATHTECDHPLCVKCFTKLKKNSFHNGEECKCPLCREYL